MLFEGDIVRYNLDPYGGNNTEIIATIITINEFTITIKPLEEWPYPFHNWGETAAVSPDYVVHHVYTIAPKTPRIME